ncbi:hypothetical protein, partial [Accumulibacter sp.]|uniref:hypothetical protein n=1 Tax=Accumulibacter sp. TaxID=2053492 RepID=UPI001AC0DC48
HFFVLLQLPFRLTHLVTSIVRQQATHCLRFSRFARWQLRFLGSIVVNRESASGRGRALVR